MKKHSIFLLSFGLGTLFCFGLIKTIDASTELARVNGTIITLENFNQKYSDGLKFFPGKGPSKKSVLEDLIKRELAVQEAKKEGLDKDPEVIDRINTVLFQAVINKRLGKDLDAIHILDNEARDFYSKNPEIRTSHIFVAIRPDGKTADEKAAYDKIKKISENLNGKMSFAEVAQKYSEGADATMGGDIDYKMKDKLDPAYYEAARKLKVGQVSGIVKSQIGYHLIKLTGLKTWGEVDQAQVKQLVLKEKQVDLFEKYIGQLRKQASVSVHGDLLKD